MSPPHESRQGGAAFEAARRAMAVLLVILLLAEHFGAADASVKDSAELEEMAIQAALEGDPEASRRDIRRHLRRLAREAEQALAGAPAAAEQRRHFNKFLFEQAGFAGESDQTTGDGLLLHRVLDRRRGTCVGLAQVYLILAERLDLPVVAAATPAHLFARWLEDSGHVNVELLERGADVSDETYRERHRIREADPAHSVYLRSLGPAEVLARVYNNLGVIRSRAGRLEAATGHYTRAIELDPCFPAPHYNRGLDHLNAGRPAEALRDLDAALAIYPADAWALNNRGLARLHLGETKGAIENFEWALALDSGLEPARKNLAIARSRASASEAGEGLPTGAPAGPPASGEPAAARP